MVKPEFGNVLRGGKKNKFFATNWTDLFGKVKMWQCIGRFAGWATMLMFRDELDRSLW
jgi:hypothetical protein